MLLKILINAMRNIIIIIICLYSIVCNAQIVKYTPKDIIAINSHAIESFNKCIKNNKILPKRIKDPSLFKDVKIIAIPTCKIKDEQCWVIDTLKNPYLSLIMKNDTCFGVISSDDCGNSYIDIDYAYKLNMGITSNVNYLANIVTHSCDSLLFNLRGTEDYILFMYYQNEIKYVNIITDFIENEEYYKTESFNINKVNFKDLDSISNCGLPLRDKMKNSRKNLKHLLESIQYN